MLLKFGFDVVVLVVGLGLMGFVLGFVLKDVILNLVVGVMIVFYKFIKFGNYIEVSNLKGIVIDFNLCYIIIKGEGVVYLIFNFLILSNKVLIIDCEDD